MVGARTNMSLDRSGPAIAHPVIVPEFLRKLLSGEIPVVRSSPSESRHGAGQTGSPAPALMATGAQSLSVLPAPITLEGKRLRRSGIPVEVTTSCPSINTDSARIMKEAETAIRLREHDYFLAERAYILDGLDLIRVKEAVGHGHFEAWCTEALGYSKATARRKMKAALLFGPVLKTRTVRDLPAATLGYLITAKKTPATIQASIVARLIEGEELNPKAVRADIKRALAVRATATQELSGSAGANSKAPNAEQAAEHAATMVRDRFGADEWSEFITLVCAAHPSTFVSALKSK